MERGGIISMATKETKHINMALVNSTFDLGNKVYGVLGPRNTCCGEITAYQTWAAENGKDEILVMPFAARLSVFTITDYFSDIDDDAIPFRYLTDDKEEAERWSKVIFVECSDEDWFIAIGHRPTVAEMVEAGKRGLFDSEDSLEESELGSCCSNIAAIRNILVRSQERGSIIGWEAEHLQLLVDSSGHDMPEDAPVLADILKQLNIEWKGS